MPLFSPKELREEGLDVSETLFPKPSWDEIGIDLSKFTDILDVASGLIGGGTAAAKPVALGVIHPLIKSLGGGTKLLNQMLKTSSLPATQAKEKFMDMWKGTYGSDVLEGLVRESTNPKSRTTTILMSPDDFHRLAMPRTPAVESFMGSEGKRQSIREGLKTKEGLSEIPTITISRLGKDSYRVTGHNGRHRMDVFKEQGLEDVPVRVTILDNPNGARWGEHGIKIDKVLNERQTEIVPWKWKPLFEELLYGNIR